MIKLKFLALFVLAILPLSANAAFDVAARTAILQDFLSG